MKKLTLPKNRYKGIKVFCKKCRMDNSKCNHFKDQVYRVRIHVPGTKNSIKSKVLTAKIYEDAVAEAIQFEKDLVSNSFEKIVYNIDFGNDYNVIDAIIKYNQYLSGQSEFVHLKKKVTKEYTNEVIRYCKLFAQNLKLTKNISRIKPIDINKQDVANFYSWAESHYGAKTFNKCLNAIRGFFEFLIDVEEIEMKNPFRSFVPKILPLPNIDIITKDEFNNILKAIDSYTPLKMLGGKCYTKNLYKPYLKTGFKLFLLTGGRREV
jgi:hypothetical protein